MLSLGVPTEKGSGLSEINSCMKLALENLELMLKSGAYFILAENTNNLMESLISVFMICRSLSLSHFKAFIW